VPSEAGDRAGISPAMAEDDGRVGGMQHLGFLPGPLRARNGAPTLPRGTRGR